MVLGVRSLRIVPVRGASDSPTSGNVRLPDSPFFHPHIFQIGAGWIGIPPYVKEKAFGNYIRPPTSCPLGVGGVTECSLNKETGDPRQQCCGSPVPYFGPSLSAPAPNSEDMECGAGGQGLRLASPGSPSARRPTTCSHSQRER